MRFPIDVKAKAIKLLKIKKETKLNSADMYKSLLEFYLKDEETKEKVKAIIAFILYTAKGGDEKDNWFKACEIVENEEGYKNLLSIMTIQEKSLLTFIENFKVKNIN